MKIDLSRHKSRIMASSFIHINTGVTVSGNFPFYMFVCGREDSSEFGCGIQIAQCPESEIYARGM